MSTLSALLKNIRKESFWKEIQFNSYAIQGTSIIFQTCLGSVAAALSLSVDAYIALGFVTVTNIVANALIISQSPMKWIIGSTIISVITSIAVTIYTLLL